MINLSIGKKNLLGKSVRFTLNVMMGIPSIIVGLLEVVRDAGKYQESQRSKACSR